MSKQTNTAKSAAQVAKAAATKSIAASALEIATKGAQAKESLKASKAASKAPSKPVVTKPAAPAAVPVTADTLAAQLAAVTAAPATEQAPKAPKASGKARASSKGLMLVVTTKGAALKFKNAEHRNAVSWAAIAGLCAEVGEAVSYAELAEVVPGHTDYIGYCVRNGWLAAQSTQATAQQ